MTDRDYSQLRQIGRDALKKWRAGLTPEELSEIGRAARAARTTNPGAFKAGDPRTKEAGRKGGAAGKNRVRPT
jgi:general stress protein YciG